MSILFDANTEHIAVEDNAKWNWTMSVDDRSWSFWYKTTSLPNVDGEYHSFNILDESGGSKTQIILIDYNGTLILLCTNHTSAWGNDGSFYCVWTPSLDTWYHLYVGASTDGDCEIAINGSGQSVTHAGWDNSTLIEPSSIQISNSVAIYDDYTMCHMTIFDSLLTSGNLTSIIADPRWCLDHEDLIFYMPMDERSGNILKDYSGTPTNGTLTNSPTLVDDFPDIYNPTTGTWVRDLNA